MKNLVIICAGGFGREMASWAPQCQGYNTKWTLKGFIDSSGNRLDNYKTSIEMLSTIDDYIIEDNDVFICALGDVKLREKYVKKIIKKGGIFMSLVHQSSILSSNNITIGDGCFIGPRTTISCDVQIEDHVSLNCHIDIGHDVKIGSFSHLNPYAFIGGNCKIGKFVTIHPHAVITPNKTLGDECVVGAGSVVLRNVKFGTSVFGAPAKNNL